MLLTQKQPLKMLVSRLNQKISGKGLDIALILSITILFWKTLLWITNTNYPIVVVSSSSMEPGFHRGDILFLTLPKNEAIEINDICVFELPKRNIPIVHRVIRVHKNIETKKEYILTKGDNNEKDDRVLYDEDQMWIHKENIVGIVKGFVPYIGMIMIVIHEYPFIKFIVLGVLGIFAIIHPE